MRIGILHETWYHYDTPAKGVIQTLRLTPRNHDGQYVINWRVEVSEEALKKQELIETAAAREPRHRSRVAFLEDYDIALAKELVQGVDVWINTPRRPWEACGTSGMKVLVNGGLNCSILDGWWDEAFAPNVGWSIGDERGGEAAEVDARDALSLYDTLESRIVPEFYDRDMEGLPRKWLARIRASMSALKNAILRMSSQALTLLPSALMREPHALLGHRSHLSATGFMAAVEGPMPLSDQHEGGRYCC